MKKFDGKIVLELGTSVGSVDMIKYAKNNGAYIIVADYLEPSRSAAKEYADLSYPISTTDIDRLIEICKQNNVNAVMSGVSELNLQMAQAIASKCCFPAYYTSEQWNKFMNKDSFRHICDTYHVSTPQTYYSGSPENINNINEYTYPVIIKPVDSCANAGISICYNSDELKTAIPHASEYSNSGAIIIEQFVEGEEISCTYVIQKKICKMVCMGTKYPYVNANGLKALSHAYIYPSNCLEEYLATENENVERMFLSEGLDNCTVFVQGIHNNGKFYIFEAGLRMEGTGSYRLTSKMSGENFMEFMVDNALGVESDYRLEKEDPTFHGDKCVIFSQIAVGGKIAGTSGYEEIKNNNMIIASEQRHFPGDEIQPDGTLRQIMFRYLIHGEDMHSVISFISEIQKTVKVYDEHGNNMLITDFDPSILME